MELLEEIHCLDSLRAIGMNIIQRECIIFKSVKLLEKINKLFKEKKLCRKHAKHLLKLIASKFGGPLRLLNILEESESIILEDSYHFSLRSREEFVSLLDFVRSFYAFKFVAVNSMSLEQEDVKYGLEVREDLKKNGLLDKYDNFILNESNKKFCSSLRKALMSDNIKPLREKHYKVIYNRYVKGKDYLSKYWI